MAQANKQLLLQQQQEKEALLQQQLAKEREQALLLQKEQELYGKKLFRPKDIEVIWKSDKPKQYVTDKLMEYIKSMDQSNISSYGEPFNQPYNEFEQRYERDDVQWMADYNIYNLVFCIEDLKLKDSLTILQIVNSMFESTNPFTQCGSLNDMTNLSYSDLKETLSKLFEEKKVSKVQIKQILDYMRRTHSKHAPLYYACSQKQTQHNKNLTIYMPEPNIATNLNTNCQEIIEPVVIDYEALRRKQEEELRNQQNAMNEDDFEEEVDPENPLYGLEQRLRNMNLDEESLRIIKEKLMSANNKIKQALEDRQKNIDSRLAEKPGQKKK